MKDAIQAFSYPQVYPGYTDKILSTLLNHSDESHAAHLAVLYVEATAPVLDSTDKMTMYMDALIRTDVDSAFRYQVSESRHVGLMSSVPLQNPFDKIYL